MSRVNDPNRNHNRHPERDRRRRNEEAIRRLRTGSRSRSRSRNRNGRRNHNNGSSQRHHGRDLLLATDNLIELRIEQFPDNSFAKLNSNLYCQACDKILNPKKTNVRRHIGLFYMLILLCFCEYLHLICIFASRRR